MRHGGDGVGEGIRALPALQRPREGARPRPATRDPRQRSSEAVLTPLAWLGGAKGIGLASEKGFLDLKGKGDLKLGTHNFSCPRRPGAVKRP